MAKRKAKLLDNPLKDNRGDTALIVDVALREGSLLARRIAARKLAGGDMKKAHLPSPASFTKRIVASGLARLAARSIPGTLLVGSGLVAKALFDRRKRRGQSEE